MYLVYERGCKDAQGGDRVYKDIPNEEHRRELQIHNLQDKLKENKRRLIKHMM